jgi:UDP-N-acetylmuramate dehydrogenase
MEQRLRESLSSVMQGRIVFDPPLSRFTSLKVGGPAWAWAAPESGEELGKLLELLLLDSVPYTVIGNGSNLLASDTGYEGVLISLERCFGDVDFLTEGGPVMAEAGAGANLSALVHRCTSLGYTGLEFAAGIPGTVGGAVRMNAGASGGQMEDIVRFVDVVTPNGDRIVMDWDELHFTYRNLALQPGWIIARATLKLTVSTPEVVEARVRELLARRAGQPRARGVAGSIFKNPPGDAAGRLIERAGFKGFAIGGARVSEEHANWIVTDGQAKARDVLSIMDKVRETVFDKFGARLEPEIILLGFNNIREYGTEKKQI